MTTRSARARGRLLLLLAAVAGLAACPSRAPDDPLDPGSGGASGVGGTGGATRTDGPQGADGSAAPMAEPAAIEPLPVTTFAFYRLASLPDGKPVYHLWVRDVVSGEERLVSRLDDWVSTLRSTAGDRLSISPDRRWIALAAGLRYGDEDLHLLGRTRMIWKVSADGKQLVRISAPIADWRASCTPNLPASSDECPDDMFCDVNSRKCTFDFWSESYEHPVWSPDGKTIFAHMGITACDNVGCNKFMAFHFPLIVINHVLTFANQPRAPAVRIPLPKGSPCSTNQLALSPDGSKIAALHSRCFAPGSSGVLVADANGANPVEFPGRNCSHMEWRADGQAIYCAEKNALRLLTVADHQTLGVFAFEEAVAFERFTFSKDGRWLVAQLMENDRKDFYRVDLQATPLAPGADFEAITDAPSDIWPAF